MPLRAHHAPPLEFTLGLDRDTLSRQWVIVNRRGLNVTHHTGENAP
jgi:hypothetical protein